MNYNYHNLTSEAFKMYASFLSAGFGSGDAFELTKLVHGEEEATKAQESARALFSGGNAADMPTVELTADDMTDSAIDILSLLVKGGLCASRSEARRAVEQGGVAVDGEKVTDIRKAFAPTDIPEEGLVLRRGKKNFRKVKNNLPFLLRFSYSYVSM